MLYWAAVFFVISLLAAIFGFTGIVAVEDAADCFKVLFVVFLALAIVSLVFSREMGEKRPFLYDALLAIAGGLTLLTVGVWVFSPNDVPKPVKPIKPAAPVVLAPIGVPQPSSTPTPASSAPSTDDLERERIRSAVQRCKVEGRVPVFGYGWEVVCLRDSSIAWHEGPVAP